LRMGELEQVATPQEIYRRPATAYTAQFIGHTNLLRGEVRGGIVRCNSLSWKAQLPDGPALFSLRPENVRIVGSATPVADASVRVRGKVRHQAFHGATELLQIECADGLIFSVRTASRADGQGELELDFHPVDAVLVKESANRN